MLAAVETQNLVELEALITHLHGDPPLHAFRELFDCEPNGVCAAIKAAVGDRALFRAPTDGHVDFRWRIVIKIGHLTL